MYQRTVIATMFFLLFFIIKFLNFKNKDKKKSERQPDDVQHKICIYFNTVGVIFRDGLLKEIYMDCIKL